MRARIRVLVASAALAAVAGCASVPTAGPVESETLGPGDDQQVQLDILVEGPQRGYGPQQVVRGFLEAMAAYQPGHPVAREYLTPKANQKWRPTSTYVYEGDRVPPVAEPQPGRVVLRATKVAEVGADGAWMPAPTGEELNIDFGVTRARGEWRIGRPPEALILSRYFFDREYEQHNLYYFDPLFQTLVPDPVYIPVRGNAETLLVQALLRGPSRWLKPAVRTAFPGGTRLMSPQVRIRGGTATIDLDRKALGLSDSRQRLVLAQLSYTLRQVLRIDRIGIAVDRVPVRMESNTSGSGGDRWASFDPTGRSGSESAYALSGGDVVIVGPNGLAPVTGPLGKNHLAPRSVAVSILGESRSGADDRDRIDSDRIATVSRDGRRVDLWNSPNLPPRTVYRGQDIQEPSWDRTGKLWLVDRRGGRAILRVVDEQNKLRRVRAEGLAGEDVRALTVSRDGLRVAALVEKPSGTRLLVGWVERGDDLRILGLRELPLPLDSITDLAWKESDELAVVGRHGEGPRQPRLVTIDGSVVTDLSDAPNARTIAAAPGQPLLLGTADRHIYVEDERFRWLDRGTGGSPVYAN